MSVGYIDEYVIMNKEKKPLLSLDIDFVLGLAVDYSILLHNKADSNNIKSCLKLILEKYKEDYERVIIEL